MASVSNEIIASIDPEDRVRIDRLIETLHRLADRDKGTAEAADGGLTWYEWFHVEQAAKGFGCGTINEYPILLAAIEKATEQDIGTGTDPRWIRGVCVGLIAARKLFAKNF